MTPRLIALALALVLLVTQQLGLPHLLSHGLQASGLATAASTSAHPADHAATASATSTDADSAADGLCQACLALVVLGTATLPALLRWAAVVIRAAAPEAPAWRPVRRGAGAPYLARAPPLRA
jgi:hypothetical protein